MKLNKTIGRVATTLVATAMLASLAAVPAFADEGEFSSSTITINKVLEMPADVNVPEVSFQFSINTLSEVDEEYVDGDVTLDVKAGTAGVENAGVAQIESTASTTPKGNNKTVTVPVTLTLPNETYTEAGVYKYTIDEVNPTLDGVTDQTGSLDLYLIVTRTNEGPIGDSETFKVSGAVIKDASDKKTATWTNYYKLNDDGESEVGTISVTKKIAGAMGNMNDEFEFTIGIPNDGVKYSYYINDELQDGTLDYTTNKVTLGHNDTLKVVGLDDKENITVTETIPENSGYETTEITNDNDLDLDNGITLTVDKNNVKATVFTNTRDAVTPTGIVMNVAPYALLVVIAAAGCFVFLRKRRED